MDNKSKVQKTLIEELGLSGLPQEKQEEVSIKMTEVVLKRIFLETMEKLSDDAKEKYQKIIEEKTNPDKVEEFLKANINDYDGMIQQVVENFKKEMKNNS